MRIIVLSLASLLLSPFIAPSVAAAQEQAAAIFQQKCTACHTIGGGKRVGPDLAGVTQRRQTDWLVRWITRPDAMLAEKDPIAVQLLAESAQVPMPNLGVQESEARALIEYIGAQSAAASAPSTAAPAPVVLPPPSLGPVQRTALILFLLLTVLITVVFIAVAVSTRRPSTVDVKKAYGLRRVFLFVAAGGLLVALAGTLSRTPYPGADSRPDHIVYVAARQFDFYFSLEPIVSVADLSTVPLVKHLELPVGSSTEFRVTSLDVNHNFALYGPERRLLAQTQAMPGYVNRLRVHLDAAGRYQVLCLEYCGAGHHLMQIELTVK